ncbi:hypothetical protein ES703_55625 [subsurface metagenome]
MYQCPGCGAWFSTYWELIDHVQICPGPEPGYWCPTCGAGPFSSQAELDAHMAAAHPPPPQYYCPYCGAAFSSQAELDAHIATAHPPPVVPCTISISAPASAAEGETVSVSATISNVSPYHYSYKTEILAGGTLLLSTDEVITSGSSRTYNAAFAMPGYDVTILVWVERWSFDHWTYDNAASRVVALLAPQPYTKQVTVTVRNTSTRGGIGTSATLEVTVGARLRGTERIGPFVSSMSFGPGETKTIQFDIAIGSTDVGYQLTTDALVARPDGGIIASDTKVEVV